MKRGNSFIYANVVATFALILSMTGGAYALIVNGQLVQDESLTGADIKNGSLSGDDIDASSLDTTVWAHGQILGDFGSVIRTASARVMYVDRVAPGRYCIRFSEPLPLDRGESAVVSLAGQHRPYFIVALNGTAIPLALANCDDPNKLVVVINDANGVGRDARFNFIVP